MHGSLTSADNAKSRRTTQSGEDFPPFVAHPLVNSGHLQTIFAVYFPGRYPKYAAVQHRLQMPDGDCLILHDDRPADWQPKQRVVLMLHGLGGSHGSFYLRRMVHKLNAQAVRVFRLDMRGCGAGFGLAQLPYHSGRTEDVVAAIRKIELLCPGSPVSLIGFSLGANISLKLLGEIGSNAIGGLDSALAVAPPADLDLCSRVMSRGFNRIYDWHFVRTLKRHVRRQARRLPNSPAAQFAVRPRTLRQFDDAYTAPLSGFADVADYYRRCSSLAFVESIRIPTWIITAADDPFIPPTPLLQAALPPQVRLHITAGGGHLGFIARPGTDGDCRWLDWRVVEWVQRMGTERRCPPTESA